MDTQKLQYGELPTLVRLAYMLVAFVTVSIFAQSLAMRLIIDPLALGSAASLPAPIIVLIASYKLIRKKNSKSFYSALALLACSPLFTAYAIFGVSHLTSNYPTVLMWWPMANALLLYACISSLFSPTTRSFYHGSTT